MRAMNQRIVIAADGLPRRAFTVADVEQMVACGLIDPDERLEVVDGEILPMSPKGPLHETLKQHLNIHLARHIPAETTFLPEPGWHLGKMLYLEPDFLVFPADLSIAAVKGPDALLVIEIADTSLRYDSVQKAALYVSVGVREYWVIDAGSRSTRVHRQPAARRFEAITQVTAEEMLRPAFLPDYAVRLAHLPGA